MRCHFRIYVSGFFKCMIDPMLQQRPCGCTCLESLSQETCSSVGSGSGIVGAGSVDSSSGVGSLPPFCFFSWGLLIGVDFVDEICCGGSALAGLQALALGTGTFCIGVAGPRGGGVVLPLEGCWPKNENVCLDINHVFPGWP